MPTCKSLDTSGLPAWLNQQYIEKALRLKVGDNTIKIVKFEVVPASAKGDNYVGVMSRINVEYASEKFEGIKAIRYILKSTLEGDNESEAAKMVEAYGAYQQEMHMYDKVFPLLRDILDRVEYKGDLAPRTIKVDYEHESILLEDLTVFGYKMANVRQGLDLGQAKLILEKLAKFHAASAVANEKHPGLFKNFDRGIFTKHTSAAEELFQRNFEVCGKLVQSWKGYEAYGEKIMHLGREIMKCGCDVVEPKNHHLNVLNHGDLWCNNAMFKYNDSGEAIDVILLDFQFSCWSSPTIDLHYFLNTSIPEEIVANNLEDLVQFYYRNLVETLRSLNFLGKIPTLYDFWQQYAETEFYAVFSSLFSQPLMIVEATEDASLESLMQNTDQSKRFRNAIYDNEKVHRNLKRRLPIFDKKGLLDLQF